MRGFIPLLLVCLLLVFSGRVQAQGGIRAIFWNLEPITTGFNGDAQHYGIGFDRDLNDRLSMGITLRRSFELPSTVVNYRSAFHFSDNESTSFYMGPSVGLRTFRSGSYGMQVPVGYRIGVRGGLEHFFADLYVGGSYILGATGPTITSDGTDAADLRKLTFCVGLEMGWGWAGRRGDR
jgi:hypothetical protein